MYYASIGIISIIVLVIVNFEALRKVKGPEKSELRTKYRCFLLSLISYFTADAFWGIFNEQQWVVITYIDTILDFSTMVLSVVFWVKCVVIFIESKGKLTKIFLASGWFIFIFEMVILTVNLFVPIVFTFSADKVYQALPARYIALFMQMILFFASAVYAFYVSSKSEGITNHHYMTVGFSGIIMAVFITFQMLFPFMPFYALGCLFATCAIHTFIYREKDIEHGREMEKANRRALIDGLTGVKNKLAYLESLRDLELQAKELSYEGYGVVVFDLNGLKEVNDTLGHDAGDEYLRNGCKMICETFTHSPVYRIGGDEFVVILKGSDFENREVLKEQFDKMIDENLGNGTTVISSGMAVFDPDIDESYTEVFIRADKKMYERKMALKEMDKSQSV
ncbi:MAG: GGDEF domain-containing protein [Lachnospiraceae bacterium]|nr:GGDEF domain-containing protein [Lachnospiraceae bacterium]